MGQKDSKYNWVRNKISLWAGLESGDKREFLCTLAHELNHREHRRRTLLTGIYTIGLLVIVAIITLYGLIPMYAFFFV